MVPNPAAYNPQVIDPVRHDTFDPVVNRVITKLINRSNAGMDKYGVAMTRDDVDVRQWLVHLQEELLDGANYIEALLYRLEQEVKVSFDIKR